MPYRGIRPFRYADHLIFFAREEETRQLLRLVVVYRGTLLYGASGAGKSSLINAGLIPATVAHGYQPERIRVQARAGEEFVVERFDDEQPATICSVAAFRERVRSADPSQRPLLIFDQLEELITLFDTRPLSRLQREIADVLISVLRDEALPVKVLLVFREDYLAQLKQVLGARPELIDQALRLTPPGREALPTIIRGPFERYPGHFEHELTRDVAEKVQVALAERFGAGALSLSEIQTVCLRLWQSTDPDGLLEARGIQGILEDYLGEELDAFPPELKYPAVALLARMVTAAGTRNVISADDLVARVREDDDIPPERLRAALGRLENESKLVARERRREVELYEITSEFLVPWIRQRQQELIRQTERRRERRRLLVVASTMAALLAVGALIFLLLANAARNEERRRDHARSQSLGAAAVSQLQVDPAAALRTALQAYDSADTAEARAAIRAVVAQSRLDRILREPGLVWAAAYSGDGSVLATALDDHRVTLWDPRSGDRRAVLRTRSFPDTLAVDRSGRLIAAGQNNGAAHVWNLATGREVVVRHRASILDDIALSPNSHVLATAGQDSTARLWDARSGRPLATLRHRDIIVNTVAFSSDGRLVVSSGSDGTARVWRVPGGDPVATLRHGGWVEDARFSPDGRRIVTAARDARLWRVDGRLEHILRGHVGGVSRASFSPDGSVVATAGHDGTARLWDAPTGQSRALLAGHSDSIRRVEFHPAGNGLLTASDDGTARLWSVPGAEPLGVLRGHVGDITDAHFSPDGRQVVTASRDHSARLWRTAATEQPLATLGREPGAVVVSPDARWLVATFYSGAVRVWHVDDWDRGERLTTGASWGEAAFSPDSELLATSGRSRGVRLWRAPDWRPAGVLPTVEQVEGVAFRRDGRVIATVAGGTAQLWDAETRRPLPGASVQLQDTDEYAAATYPSFSRDGRLVLFSGGAAQVWDPRRPTTTLLEVDGHVANPSSMSANGDVVIGEQDGRTATWRIRGARLDPLAQRAGEGAALNPAGSVAITGGEGRATEMWASDGGRRIRTLPTPDGAAWAGFSPTGRFVATAAFTGGARLWDTATGTEIVAFAASESLDTITRATIGPDDTRIFVAADRLRVHRCDACAPFPKVLELARSRAEVLR